jgi:hypothetical protein
VRFITVMIPRCKCLRAWGLMSAHPGPRYGRAHSRPNLYLQAISLDRWVCDLVVACSKIYHAWRLSFGRFGFMLLPTSGNFACTFATMPAGLAACERICSASSACFLSGIGKDPSGPALGAAARSDFVSFAIVFPRMWSESRTRTASPTPK